MRRLAEINRRKLIDVLTERAAAERASARLYGRVVDRVARSEPAIRRMAPRLADQRDREIDHGRWLDGQLHALGADAFAPSERAQRVTIELRGLEELILDGHATVAEMLHALLGVELMDAAGWDLLVGLAERAGDDFARRDFAERRDDAEEHADYLRQALMEMLRNDVLGVPVTLPSAL